MNWVNSIFSMSFANTTKKTKKQRHCKPTFICDDFLRLARYNLVSCEKKKFTFYAKHSYCCLDQYGNELFLQIHIIWHQTVRNILRKRGSRDSQKKFSHANKCWLSEWMEWKLKFWELFLVSQCWKHWWYIFDIQCVNISFVDYFL